jgi:hypothetical protein
LALLLRNETAAVLLLTAYVFFVLYILTVYYTARGRMLPLFTFYAAVFCILSMAAAPPLVSARTLLPFIYLSFCVLADLLCAALVPWARRLPLWIALTALFAACAYGAGESISVYSGLSAPFEQNERALREAAEAEAISVDLLPIFRANGSLVAYGEETDQWIREYYGLPEQTGLNRPR